MGRRKKVARTDIRITTVKLRADMHPGPQLRALRKMMGITAIELGAQIGLCSANMSHFELADKMFAKYHNTTLVFKYAAALGATKVEYTL